MRTDAIAKFFAAVGSIDSQEVVAAAFGEHLAQVTAASLPALAQPHWRDVAKLLKSPADKPIPSKAIGAIRSWPASRIEEVVTLMRKADDVLEKLENERLEDEIRDSIRRHYL